MNCLKYKFALICTPLLFFSGNFIYAQKNSPGKAEQKQYEKIVAKPSAKAINKFLNKWPDSAYKEELLFKKDSIAYDSLKKNDENAVEDFVEKNGKSAFLQQALEIMKQQSVPQTGADEATSTVKKFKGEAAIGSNKVSYLQYRRRGKEHIAVFELMPEGKDFETVLVTSYVKNAGNWEEEYCESIPKYIMDPAADRSTMAAEPRIVFIREKRYMLLDFLNYSTNATEICLEYVSNLISCDAKEYTNSIFYGTNLSGKAPDEDESWEIEGRSAESMAQGGLSNEQIFLAEHMSGNPKLKEIRPEDALSDDAIVWWKEANPDAMGKAKSLHFGNLPDDCSLVSAFRKAKKEQSRNYSAAILDFRGYTVIVSCSKSSGKYSLVWAEPICRNSRTDRYLASIYFDTNGTTLNLFYYKGKTTFKYFINLSSKAIRR
ncbi:MAG: hypothetical protein MJY92_07125 [Bacteroidales bacterium]|nr:hypothetical protein [Bacteroidales bacterium]